MLVSKSNQTTPAGFFFFLMTHPSLNLDTTMTGPKDSSLAMNMWSSTSVNTVGSMKKPEENLSYWLVARANYDAKEKTEKQDFFDSQSTEKCIK